MGELRALQRRMAEAVMRPLDRADRTPRRWVDGRPMGEVAGEILAANGRLSPVERLEIYQRSYWFRLLNSFAEDFPGLRAVLGERRFRAMARAYLERHPSRSFTLRNLGSRLARFLEAEPEWARPRADMAVDMVRLEWAMIEAFDGAAHPPATVDDLLGHDPARLKLKLQPYLTLLRMRYPLDEAWAELKSHDALRTDASNAVARPHRQTRERVLRRIRPEPVTLVVHRHDQSVYYRRLEPAAFRILSALRRGASLAEACGRVTGLDAAAVQGWFQDWSALGWFCLPGRPARVPR